MDRSQQIHTHTTLSAARFPVVTSSLLLLVGICALVASPHFVEARDKARQRPLDLPAGVSGRVAEEDEDISESILFLGNEYNGEAFVWVLDVSCSMTGNPMGVLIDEVRTSIQSLSQRSEFGLVAFACGVDRYNHKPVHATASNKLAGDAWLTNLEPYGQTCMAAGVVEALEIANRSQRRKVNVILVSDGVPTCGDCAYTKSSIDTANFKDHPIHTIFVGTGPGADCLQSLIANGGSYNQISL